MRSGRSTSWLVDGQHTRGGPTDLPDRELVASVPADLLFLRQAGNGNDD